MAKDKHHVGPLGMLSREMESIGLFLAPHLHVEARGSVLAWDWYDLLEHVCEVLMCTLFD